MPRRSFTKCHFGCESDVPIHHFPSYEYPHEERFQLWKSVLDLATQNRDNAYIYNSIRLCHRRFDKMYCLPSKRLTANSIPTLNLPSSSGLSNQSSHSKQPFIENALSSQELHGQVSTEIMESAPLYPSPYPKPTIQKENLTMSQNLSAPIQTAPPLLGPTNTNTTCHFCQASIKTAVKYTTTTRTHIAAALCCLICCLGCMPYCAASGRNADHYCPNCHKYLGTYQK